MKDPIQKHLGRWWDLSKIVSIGEVSYYGPGVSVDIYAQLMDSPILVKFERRDDEEWINEDGWRLALYNDDGEPLSLVRARREVEQMIAAWREVAKC